MCAEFHAFVFPAGASPRTSEVLTVQDLTDKYVQIGAYTGTGAIEGSIDGTNFFVIGTGLAAGSITAVPQHLKYLRLTATFTAGTPAGALSARNARSDGG